VPDAAASAVEARRVDPHAPTHAPARAPVSGAGPAITVFTATYNRAHTLARVYRSLQAQTFRDFEWIVVDDGSTDDTRALVARWAAEAGFPIRYLWQENQGKHRAYNRAVGEARGELFLDFDSDDACVPQALERFKHHWEAIPESERSGFSSIAALCVDDHDRVMGTTFRAPVTDSHNLEARCRHRVAGEKWRIHRTATLREYPFPDFTGSHVPEGILWDRIGRRYKTRFVNEVLRIYHTDQPSLTRSGGVVLGAPVGRLEHLTNLNENLDYLKHAPLELYRSGVHYARFSLHAGVGARRQLADVRTPGGKLVCALALPVGWLVYLRDRRRAARVAAGGPR
jgi:glycosyltransferase involved in cell wall biosynthesis